MSLTRAIYRILFNKTMFTPETITTYVKQRNLMINSLPLNIELKYPNYYVVENHHFSAFKPNQIFSKTELEPGVYFEIGRLL